MELLKSYFNVDQVVKAEVDKLEATRATLARMEKQEKLRKVEREAELVALNKKVTDLRVEYKDSSRPALERADELSLAGIFFKQVSDAVADSYRYVQNIMQNETQQYGYVAKNVLSLSLSLEALQTAMASGRPFHHELAAFKENVGDIDQELAVWADVLQHFAFKGLPQKSDAHASAVRFAHAIKEVELYRVTDADQPRSFLDFLKFSTARFMPAFRPEVYADYANLILDSTRAEDWATATRNADSAAKVFGMEKLNKNPLDPSVWGVQRGQTAMTKIPPAAAYYQFRECISGIVVAQQFHQYCQAALTMQQYRLTESFLH